MAKYSQIELDNLIESFDDDFNQLKNETGNIVGMATIGRPITKTLYVSPIGNNSDGSNWDNAYNELSTALDACSTNVNESTLILLGINDTFYDINRPGDPTWSANVEIVGPHRRWVSIRNTNAQATSILKFTGKASIQNCAIAQLDNIDGIIITGQGFRIRQCGFNSSTCNVPVTSINITNTNDVTGGILDDVKIIGNKTYTTGLKINNVITNDFKNLAINDCLLGLEIDGIESFNNTFENLNITTCEKGIKISNGSQEIFEDVTFENNTINVDDIIDSNIWNKIYGAFPTILYPENLIGIEIPCGNNEYGVNTELIPTNAISKPFKIISYYIEPSTDNNIILKLSADDGLTYFKKGITSSKKNKATGGTPGLEYIFNAGTKIIGNAQTNISGQTATIWLEIQEI